MLSTQRLKKDLQMNSELDELLDALKWIAVSQFQMLQKKRERFSEFMDAFDGFFQMIDFSSAWHPFVAGKGKLGIIMVTSDEGFMGGLNTRVIDTALSYPKAAEAELIIIGERGAGYLKDMGYSFTQFPGVEADERYEAALKMKDYIVKESLGGRLGSVVIAYPTPVTFTVQKVEMLKILPCDEIFEKRKQRTEQAQRVIVESPLEDIIEYLVKLYITQKLFEIFEDSKLAEFSARSVHLEESHQALLKREKSLRFQFFRSRHNQIDKGMREIFSSQLLRK